MAYGLGLVDVANLVAGVSIVGVGLFVLTAKPRATLNRLFFVLALMDGASTLLFGLVLLADAPGARLYFAATYYYHFLAFLALLAIFGLVFPKPVAPRALRHGLIALVALAFAASVALFALDHSLFWIPAPALAIPMETRPLGNLANLAFVGLPAALVVRMARAFGRETSESHRRQSAYVLGGMALAYLPFPATIVAQDLALRGLTPFTRGRWDQILSHWGYLAACLAVLAAALALAARRRQDAAGERRFVLACLATVVALAAVSLALPDASVGYALRVLALLAYPALLGYAIVRYEVFDIDRRLRRAATVTLTALALTVGFAIAESAAENLLASRALAGVPSGFASGTAAAVIIAFAFVPVARASRKAAARLVPELGEDEIHARKLEIYRHSVAGALADGILREGESRTLAALRASLGITDGEHTAIVAQVETA